MRIIVCGGRDYPNRMKVFDTLDNLLAEHGNLFVIHGACCKKNFPNDLSGADRWAQEWAQERQQPYCGVPARWAKIGISAGPRRNAQMVRFNPELVVAFPGGDGTANMIRLAKADGIEVLEITDKV